MTSMNRATLIGRVGSDVEIRRTQNGEAIANLRLATSETWRDKQTGERREKTEWHSVVSFNDGLNKVIEAYVKKGSRILVEGAIQTREWQDKDGNKRYSTEIVLQKFGGNLVLLDSAKSGDDGQRDEKRVSKTVDMDDEIPF